MGNPATATHTMNPETPRRGWFDRKPSISEQHRRASITGGGLGADQKWLKELRSPSFSEEESPRRMSMNAITNIIKRRSSSIGSNASLGESAIIEESGGVPHNLYDEDAKMNEFHRSSSSNRRHSFATPSMPAKSLDAALKRPPSPTSERILAGDFTHGF